MEHQATLYAALVAVVGTAALLSLGRSLPNLGLAIQALRLRSVGPGDVTRGPVVVTGTPVPLSGPVESPWTDADCVAFDADVKQHSRRRHGSNWRPVRTMAREVPFEIRGPTGAVEVDPEEADLEMKETYRAVTEEKSPPPPSEADPGLSRLPLVQFSSEGTYKYVERRIDPTDTVTVFGVAEYDSPADTTPEITGGGSGLLAPPFAVYANAGSSPARSIALRTFGLLAVGLLSLVTAAFLALELFGI